MVLIFLIAIFLLIFGIIEKRHFREKIDQIPLRIQVNGTRGKSTLVRMIVDLFSQAGYSVAAKITGEMPEFFSGETHWQKWKRHSPARIKEIKQFVEKVAAQNPQCLVVENMALQAEYQDMIKKEMLRPQLTILTNIRLDHQELMGENTNQIARTLSFSVPANGTLIVQQCDLEKLQRGKFKKEEDTPVRIEFFSQDKDQSRFPFEENFEILEIFSKIYNIPEPALKSTFQRWKNFLRPNKFVQKVNFNGRLKTFVNLFSCNDPDSAKLMINYLIDEKVVTTPFSVLLTCRADRPLRTIAFIEWLKRSNDWNTLAICGSIPRLKVSSLLKMKFNYQQEIVRSLRIQPAKMIPNLFLKNDVIIGMGNFVKTGEKILKYLEETEHAS